MFDAIRQVLFASALVSMFAVPWIAASAESLLLVCQSRTVRGEAAGLWIQEYSPALTKTPGFRIQLPGQHLRQPLQMVLGERFGVAIIQDTVRGERGISDEMVIFGTEPLRRSSAPQSSGWAPVQIMCGPATGADEQLLAIVERRLDGESPSGRVRLVRMRVAGEGVHWESAGSWPVPGVPKFAAADWVQGRIYVLGEGEQGGAVQLTAMGIDDEQTRSMALAVSSETAVRARPVGLALAESGGTIGVLTSAYSLTRGDGAGVSTIRWVDGTKLEAIGGLQGLAGTGDHEARALISNESGGVWARTYDEAAGFGYATSVVLRDGRHEKRREEAFRETDCGPRLELSRDGAQVALAGGRALRILATPDGAAIMRNFGQPVEAVGWGEAALYVGEGAVVHRVDPRTAETISVSDSATGFVIDLRVLSSWTLATAASAAFEEFVPPRVVLDPNTPGRDQRVIPVAIAEGETPGVVIGDGGATWLRAEFAAPAQGTALLTLALEKQALPTIEDGLVSDVSISVLGKDASSRTVSLEVEASARNEIRRVIEWPSGTRESTYEALRETLAGPPLHLSRRERRGPISRPPRGSAAVVVRLEDVARGAITRQVLLDYVSGGGGLLVIAGHSTESGGEGLRRWLEPLGLLIEIGESVDGRFPVTPNPYVNFGVDQIAIAAGAYMEVTRPMDVCVPGPAAGTAVLALTRYGYGRLGVLASETPLGERAMAQTGGRRFARALFGWLSGANGTARDSDQDGLRDDAEDANGDGAVEAGETDWVREDSDGDGVPDGREDSNLNGIVDEGETDPRRTDTDGDAIADGADAEPLPSSGSPVILAVQPATAPAQGGTPLEITGRNFPANPQVWFGEQRASHVVRIDSTRLVATPPGYAFGMTKDPMAVRVAHPFGPAESTLERAFSYGNASPIRFTLESIERVRRTYDGYRGTMSIALELGDVQIEYGAFYVRTAPPMMNLNVAYERGESLIAAGREVTFRSYGPGEFWLLLGPGEPLAGRVELGTLRWHLADLAPPVSKFQWYVFLPDLRVLWGENAEVSPSEHWTELDLAEPEPILPAAGPTPP